MDPPGRISALQTFLPYADYDESARVLDNKRLFKQAVEALQIMQAMTQRRLVSQYQGQGPRGGTKWLPLPEDQWYIEHRRVGWGNHPATRMWVGAGFELLQYQDAICAEVRRRGRDDGNLVKKIDLVFIDAVDYMEMNGTPKWYGVPGFHESHRANLLHKDPEHYGQFGWTEEPQEGYLWPA